MTKHYDSIVIGAGIIGVSTALSLQKKNRHVLLIDKSDIAGQTSFGNAGVLAASSLIPLNNPQLFSELFSLLKNKQSGFRYEPHYAFKNSAWLIQFLRYAQEKYLAPRANALNQLIKRSTLLHKQWLKDANATHLLIENGWLKAYSNERAFEKSSCQQPCFEQNNVTYESFKGAELSEISTAFTKQGYSHVTFFPQACHLTDPQHAIKVYFDTFKKLGGHFLTADIQSINCNTLADNSSKNTWQITTKNQHHLQCEDMVIAAGPWTNEVLARLPKSLYFNIPMAYENGAHYEFECQKPSIPCPVYDAQGAFVLTPMHKRYRMTCGVYFAEKQFNHINPLLKTVAQFAQNAYTLPNHNGKPWYGARPTLPDSLPIIGESQHKGLWLAVGHQHIGLSTGPATGELLANQITQTQSIETQAQDALSIYLHSPFSADRFNR